MVVKDWIWKPLVAGLSATVVHFLFMYFKSRAGLLPSFQPYHTLQFTLNRWVGTDVPSFVPWALSFVNGMAILGFLFARLYQLLPGRNGATKGLAFGLIGWMLMGLIFFPVIGLGPFAFGAGLGIAPTLLSLAMLLTYSVVLGTVYAALDTWPSRMTWLMVAGLVAGAAGAASAQTHAHGHKGQPAQHSAGSDTSATRESRAAHARMMRNMAMPFTGDVDLDFRMHMIPHHQGAIDMARVALRHAKDAWTRQAAQAIIIAQQQEISEFQAWLARHGAMVPPGGEPRYIVTANTYPDPENARKEPGSRDELVGQTWAPGSGVPLQTQVSERAARSRAGGNTSATREFKAAHARMMRDMAVPFTGDPDVDFRVHMIPHHQGAIDMARVALRHAKDAWTRQAADAIITAQEKEIYEFRAWLVRHGASAADLTSKRVER